MRLPRGGTQPTAGGLTDGRGRLAADLGAVSDTIVLRGSNTTDAASRLVADLSVSVGAEGEAAGGSDAGSGRDAEERHSARARPARIGLGARPIDAPAGTFVVLLTRQGGWGVGLERC